MHSSADLIAVGLAPFSPENEGIQAGKLMSQQIGKLVAQGESFCVETTLSGRGYAKKIPLWRAQGYEVLLIFLQLNSAEQAITRVMSRVNQGGHSIPEDIIRRRFKAGLLNFEKIYKNLVNYWVLYDNSDSGLIFLANGRGHE